MLYAESGAKLENQVFDIKVLPAQVFVTPSLSAGSSLGLTVCCLLELSYLLVLHI